MPYIAPDRRDRLNKKINKLIKKLREMGNEAGDLNYTISLLLLAQFETETRYHTIARLTGVLENVKEEFYRKKAVPYEEEAIERNGDIS